MSFGASIFTSGIWLYVRAAIGPVSTALAQFLCMLALMFRLPVIDFGSVSFLIVTSQFALGIWSALFNAPLLLVLSKHDDVIKSQETLALVTMANVALIPALIVFTNIALWLGWGIKLGVCGGLYAALLLYRHFARGWGLAHAEYLAVMRADIVYAVSLILTTAWIILTPQLSVAQAMVAMLLSVIVSLIFSPLSLAVLLRFRLACVVRYRAIWARDARWSIMGVLTTEATVNSHSYIVTLLMGPKAFASIAASALFIRPVTVAINALAEFERARVARQLALGELGAVRTGRRHLRWILAVVWAGTAIVALTAIVAVPMQFMPKALTPTALTVGVGLWFLLVAVRGAHAPEGVILQAAGRFRQLAGISLFTALVTIVAVTVLTLFVGPIWSIAGVVLGEGCFAFVLWRAASKFLQQGVA